MSSDPMPSDLRAPSPPRSPWQRLYGAVLARRRRWYGKRARRLPRPVVSVGNLHWGGAGKTPLVAAIAAHLRDSGRRVAVLSRGYGGRETGVQVVSQGDGPLLGPTLAGDEPVLLAAMLPGVGVVVSPDRHRAGLHALERLAPPPDIFVLDDGFSHVRLARDLDILVFPESDPFAAGRLPPGGRLREPLTAAAHADAAVLTGADPPAGGYLASALEASGFEGPGFASRTVTLAARFESAGTLDPPARVIAISAIARPERFERAARVAGFEIVAALSLGDHHAYPESTLESIRRLWAEHSAETLLTTSKDFVKLLGRLDLPLAELPIRAQPEVAFWDWLETRLASFAPTR